MASSREWETGTRSSPSACSRRTGISRSSIARVSSCSTRKADRASSSARKSKRPSRRPRRSPVAEAGQIATTPAAPTRAGRHEREVAAHARPAQRARDAGGQEVGHGQDVGHGAAVERPLALPVTAEIGNDRGEARRLAGARERVVALLARARPVEHDDAARDLPGRAPQGVGQAVDDALVVGRGEVGAIHDGIIAPAMPQAPPASLSSVYPLGTRVNERGHLEIGGCDLADIAAEFGTPAYVVAEDDLRARARAFRTALADRHGGHGDVMFASKAFPCSAVYRVFAEEGLGCDVASGGELFMALAAGFDPARIVMHGNAKSRAELEQAVAAGVGLIALDSRHDAERLAAVTSGPQDVLLRVTPGVEADTHHAVHTGHAGSKFGVGLREAAEMIAWLQSSEHLRLRGLHMHIGSQLFDLEPFRAAVGALSALGDFPVIDVGGGLGRDLPRGRGGAERRDVDRRGHGRRARPRRP